MCFCVRTLGAETKSLIVPHFLSQICFVEWVFLLAFLFKEEQEQDWSKIVAHIFLIDPLCCSLHVYKCTTDHCEGFGWHIMR